MYKIRVLEENWKFIFPLHKPQSVRAVEYFLFPGIVGSLLPAKYSYAVAFWVRILNYEGWHRPFRIQLAPALPACIPPGDVYNTNFRMFVPLDWSSLLLYNDIELTDSVSLATRPHEKSTRYQQFENHSSRLYYIIVIFRRKWSSIKVHNPVFIIWNKYFIGAGWDGHDTWDLI